MVRIAGVQTFRVNAVIGRRDGPLTFQLHFVPYTMVYMVYTKCMQIQSQRRSICEGTKNASYHTRASRHTRVYFM